MPVCEIDGFMPSEMVEYCTFKKRYILEIIL